MKLGIASLYLLSTVIVCNSTTAQISSDGTLSTDVSTNDDINFLIQNGDRTGDNLFHSFSEFSIPNQGVAYFNNDTDIVNIFSRVTGGNISDIQGLIRANGTANLFLINPAGIVFGENASLDIGGSFFASTAESIVFGDDLEFSAIEPQEAPILTVNITPGLQMGANPGTIEINGNGHQTLVGTLTGVVDASNRPLGLSLSTGQSLVLLGGDILLRGGNITTAPGIIELGSVGANQIVNLSTDESGFTLNYDGVETFQDINLSQSSSITAIEGNQSQIRIQARDLTLTDGSNISISTSNVTNIPGGEITIRTSESVNVLGSIPTTTTNISASLVIGAEGDGGDINLETGLLKITDGAFVTVSTNTPGNAGNLNIQAEQIDISGLNPYDLVSSGIFSTALTLATGNSGNINIEADSILIRTGASIGASNLSPQGDAGNLNISANTIELRDFDQQGLFSAGIFASASGGGTGDAGDINITTDSLSIADGLVISASSSGTGAPGNVNITADLIELAGSSPLALLQVGSPTGIQPSSIVATGFGVNSNGGSVNIDANQVSLEDGAFIGVSSFFLGNAGNLQINAPHISLDNAQIQADTNAGNQGNIVLNSSNLILRNNSTITTNAGNFSDGGNITIDTNNLVALENSDITANAVQGQGGNIIITTQGLFVSPDSEITASSEFGVDGVVTINNPEADESVALLELPKDTTDPSQHIAQGCAWVRNNSFIVTGRGGTPENPTNNLVNDQMWLDIRDLQNNQSDVISTEEVFLVVSNNSSVSQSPLIEANTWIINEQGNVELVAVLNPQDNQNHFLAANCAGK